MEFATGSLVKARGREWVVLPESTEDLLVLRPLGGSNDEIAGVLTAVEKIEHASFQPPDPTRPGDYLSARLLRDALRLGFRSSAGPFRSFGHLGFEPRPYQLVPLLMALRQDPVRMLIADDVGIGKTIEAALIGRELLDQGEIRRMAVLCPPHLAEQWQKELRDKFHIDAELVVASTAARLDREVPQGRSLFELYPFTVVSTDFIKTDARRTQFVQSAPEFIIVDEAHTCAVDAGRSGHQRHRLIKELSAAPDRHVVLVTATPHSGKPDAFRSLCALLDPSFATLPDELAGSENETHRRRLARHLVQRKRGDIVHYLDDKTTFPLREEKEDAYGLTPQYRRLFDRVVEYARETVLDASDGRHRARVRWWSALALLRALASSPAAAAATLRTRAAVADTDSVEEADAVGRQIVLDLSDDDETEALDVTPGTLMAGSDDPAAPSTQGPGEGRLRDMAREADALAGDGDPKLLRVVELLNELLKDGFRPIIFCRFIATAEYVAAELGKRLKKTEVVAVTSTLPSSEREAAIASLATHERRVLVATDCLSEGINLQQGFDSVVHYDLSWNPTRHEQREGRVDRFGQAAPVVRLLTYYGKDNPIDGIVLDVLVRKSREIRRSLGVSVPFPAANEAAEAIVEGVLLRRGTAEQGAFSFMQPQQQELFAQWDRAADREKRSRTVFAQESLKVDEVRRELDAVRLAIGRGADVKQFVETTIRTHGGIVAPAKASDGKTAIRIGLTGTPPGLVDALDGEDFVASFEPPVEGEQVLLTRTHPRVERLAGWVLDTALDPLGVGRARRCGAIRTVAVDRRTTLLLLRFRMHILDERGEAERLLAEDWGLLAFAGSPTQPEWLTPEAAERLLEAMPSGNLADAQKTDFVKRVLDANDSLAPRLAEEADRRARVLEEAHQRVRKAGRLAGRRRVEAQKPPDLLGSYVFLPVG